MYCLDYKHHYYLEPRFRTSFYSQQFNIKSSIERIQRLWWSNTTCLCIAGAEGWCSTIRGRKVISLSHLYAPQLFSNTVRSFPLPVWWLFQLLEVAITTTFNSIVAYKGGAGLWSDSLWPKIISLYKNLWKISKNTILEQKQVDRPEPWLVASSAPGCIYRYVLSTNIEHRKDSYSKSNHFELTAVLDWSGDQTDGQDGKADTTTGIASLPV